jgi:predicted dehydrogenase
VIEATTATRPKDLEGSLSILGEKGSVVIGGFAVNRIDHWQFVEPEAEDAEVLEQFSVNPPDVYGFGHRAYYAHVVRVLEEDSAALVDGLEGRRSLELITALYESIASGRPVALRLDARNSRLGGAP